MSGINKVILVGRLGKDATSHDGENFEMTNFSIATSENYKSKSGEKMEKTEWHNIVCWNKLSTVIRKLVSKGALVYVEGKLSTKKEEYDGQVRYKTEIIASKVDILVYGKDKENGEPNHVSEDDIPF